MSEKPQEPWADEQEDLLEQIITQGLEKMNAPTRTTAAEDEAGAVPSPADSGGTDSPAEKKNKRSAVYFYLLILFGAAFMMLLLAYFIQQRSNENTISDLKDSMNLSRQELLDEIIALEKEKGALLEKIDSLNSDLVQWKKQYEEKDDELAFAWASYRQALDESYSWSSFWELEQYYHAEDLQNCAAVLLLLEQAEHFTYLTPDSAQERYAEIVQAVIDAGILDEDYASHPSDYVDLLYGYFYAQGEDRHIVLGNTHLYFYAG